jgi:ABC-type multidrug transport system ATPase subunit
MHIECHHLTYRYPSGPRDVFKDLDFSITQPGFHALFGPSGVGKTTLARLLTGKEKGHKGMLVTHGVSRILYSYNTERLPGWASVGEHLEAVTTSGKTDQLHELTAVFGLEGHLGSRFSQLSMGQQNRVNLTRYLVQDFDLLIMDESLANVDEATRERIILCIKEDFKEKLFLYISHNVTEVARFCREILVLRGPNRSPQVVTIRGQDQTDDRPPSHDDLERSMLEIVHAS